MGGAVASDLTPKHLLTLENSALNATIQARPRASLRSSRRHSPLRVPKFALTDNSRGTAAVIALRQGAPVDVVLDIGIGLYGGIGYRLEPDPKALAAARSGVIHACQSAA